MESEYSLENILDDCNQMAIILIPYPLFAHNRMEQEPELLGTEEILAHRDLCIHKQAVKSKQPYKQA